MSEQLEHILELLKKNAKSEAVVGMSKFGINPEKV